MWWIIALAIIIGYLSWRHGSAPWITMPEMITGIVGELPAVEAARLEIPIDVLCLARAMTSEEGGSGETARIAVGHAIRNHASNIGVSIQTLTTRTSKKTDGTRACPEADGKFSQQRFAKYCSTFHAATSNDVDLAFGIINGLIRDPTGGAALFDNPLLQDTLALAHPYNPDTKKGYKTSEEIAAKRWAAGYVPISIEGTSTRFWRRKA